MRHTKYNILNAGNEPRITSDESRVKAGSALILAVVLTSLLAIIGTMFMMAARVNKKSTSAISENKELNFAVETVIAKISEELVSDVPGVIVSSDPNLQQEYYDYPDAQNAWLANLEPYEDSPGDYRWRQISDITGFLDDKNFATRYVKVDPPGLRKVILEYPEIELDNNSELDGGNSDDGESNSELRGQLADADGDGIADSKWIKLKDVTSNKGKPIYAAIRIIDNGGMLNVNTACEFDPNEVPLICEKIDGSSQTQIDLETLARATDDIDDLNKARGLSASPTPTAMELLNYQEDVVWRIEDPCSGYTLFDISDELELRYRYCITSQALTRLENEWAYTVGYLEDFQSVPYDSYKSGANPKKWRRLDDWYGRILDPNDVQPDRRHLLTAYNMDRIIAPDGSKMFNVNIDRLDLKSEGTSWQKARELYNKLVDSIDPSLYEKAKERMEAKFAQLAVTLVDLRDGDSDVTGFDPVDDEEDVVYYGIEPYPCITEIAVRIDPCEPDKKPNYFAVELFNPFDVNIPMEDFQLVVTDYNEPVNPEIITSIDLDLGTAVMHPNDYMVICNDDSYFSISGDYIVDSTFILSDGYKVTRDPNLPFLPPVVDTNIVDAHNVAIRRMVEDVNVAGVPTDRLIYLDRQLIDKDWVRWDPNGYARYYGRNFDLETSSWWYMVYPTMEPNISGSLGANNFPGRLPFKPDIDISVPWQLVTVGDISRIWTVGPTDVLYDPCDNDGDPNIYDPSSIKSDPCDPNDIYADTNTRTIGEKLRFATRNRNSDFEELIRINLADPYYRNIFQYITVFDPNSDDIDNDGDGLIDNGELKVPGRINVNTAPWYVIAQLPWVSQRKAAHTSSDELARAIVAYRDKLDIGAVDYSGSKGRWGATGIYHIKEEPGFESIGELATVVNNKDDYSMHYYILGIEKNKDLSSYPDLYYNDGAANDFDERDVIFSRISNLVTVRSDVFTAYILVRIGTDGPQKRVIAILDRSDVYSAKKDKVKVRALQQVPDPR